MSYAKKDLCRQIHEWASGGKRYRLIASAKYSPGHVDTYIIDEQGEDSLGQPAWFQLHTWDANEAGRGGLLVGALVAALASGGGR